MAKKKLDLLELLRLTSIVLRKDEDGRAQYLTMQGAVNSAISEIVRLRKKSAAGKVTKKKPELPDDPLEAITQVLEAGGIRCQENDEESIIIRMPDGGQYAVRVSDEVEDEGLDEDDEDVDLPDLSEN